MTAKTITVHNPIAGTTREVVVHQPAADTASDSTDTLARQWCGMFVPVVDGKAILDGPRFRTRSDAVAWAKRRECAVCGQRLSFGCIHTANGGGAYGDEPHSLPNQ